MHTDQLRVVKQWNTVKHMHWVAFSARCEKWCRTPPVSEEGRAGDGWFERCSTGYDVTALAQVTIKCFFRTYPCLMTKAVLIRSTLSAGQENLDSCWLIMVPRSRRLQVVRVVHTIRSKGAPRVACGKVSCNCSMLLAVNVPPATRVGPKVRIHFVVSMAGGSCDHVDLWRYAEQANVHIWLVVGFIWFIYTHIYICTLDISWLSLISPSDESSHSDDNHSCFAWDWEFNILRMGLPWRARILMPMFSSTAHLWAHARAKMGSHGGIFGRNTRWNMGTSQSWPISA